MVEDLGHHLVHFLLLVGAAQHAQGLAGPQFTPQLFLEHVLVVGDEGVGGLENTRGGAVVLLQLHQLEAAEVGLQLHQVFRARAAPGVDRLVIVTDHGERAAQAHQLAHQQVLAGIGVLVLVHQQVVQAVLPFFEYLGLVFEEHRGQQYEVVKIQRVEGFQCTAVALVGLGEQYVCG